MEKKHYFSSYTRHVAGKSFSVKEPRGASDFLKLDASLNALLPGIARLAQLQQACHHHLPVMFHHCVVTQFAGGVLIIRAPNAAVAAKLRQYTAQLLQDLKLHWPIEDIRIKVHVKPYTPPVPARRVKILSSPALSALQQLSSSLSQDKSSQTLKQALETMIQRHAIEKSGE